MRTQYPIPDPHQFYEFAEFGRVQQFAVEETARRADALLEGGANGGAAADKQSKREVLDCLVTEEQLGVTFVNAAIENAPGTPSKAFPARAAQRGHAGVPACRGA